MFMNYGGCAVYFKEKHYSLDVDNYIYDLSNNVIRLEVYVGTNPNVVVPVPTSVE